ncbi:F-box DNA helicase 1-like [Porites lutea]|uniref:F-box DNA helicase 1-like n=1 Tax=Porites lutea TaxID=51062 RepID=UPI003CC66025
MSGQTRHQVCKLRRDGASDMPPVCASYAVTLYSLTAQENAKRHFADNVECKTLHSLAYKKVGSRYKYKLAQQLKIKTIMENLPGESEYLHAKRVQETLENFISSADDVVEVVHIPELKGKAANVSSLNSREYKLKVVSDADILWQLMKDDDNEFPMTHDGYFKIYQLQSPILTGFDYLLIDEAQDCTPAASAFLLNQTCTKILVGDPHQQIYSFRGARNALQEVESSNTFYLTQSFRFGPEIAHVASSVLKALKDIQEKTLEGVAGEGSVLNEKCSKQLNVITRTNCTLFNEAASVCHAKEDVKVGFIGGVKSLGLDRVLDIWKLRRAGSDTAKVKTLDIRDKLIKHFSTFSALEKYARDAPDPELLSKIKIVEMHVEKLEEIVQLLRSKVVRKNKADVIFSTAHKAKGLEFDHVRVAEDFLSGLDSGLYLGELEDDEKNLLYVAVSRAKKSLRLSQKIVNLIHLQKPCVKCKSQVVEELIVSGKGFFCRSCARSNFPHLEFLSLDKTAFSRFSTKLNPVGTTRVDFEDF